MAITTSIGSAARPREFMTRVLRPFGIVQEKTGKGLDAAEETKTGVNASHPHEQSKNRE